MVRRLLRLTPQEWGWLVRAYLLLLRARARRGDVREVTRLASRPHRGGDALPALTEEQRALIAQRARLIGIAARHPFLWAHCLERSLALAWWLEGEGIRVELRFGMRRVGGRLCAHAWVEYAGEVLNDRQRVVARFASLARPDHLAAGGPGAEGRP